MLRHVAGDAVEHVGHLLGRRHRLDLAVRHLQRQVEVALMAHVDDLGQRPGSNQQVTHGLHGPLGGRQPDPRRPPVAHGLQALQRQCQVGAPLVAGHCVDLVDDDRLDRAQRLTPAFAGQQQVERLGRGDHEAGRSPHHGGALPRRGVAGAHSHPDVGRVEAQLRRHARDLGQGPLEVLGDVHGQRLQRRHVDGGRPVADVAPLGVGSVEGVDRHQEPGQRLAGARGRGDQRVVPGGDERPSQPLRLGRSFGEASVEPLGNRRVEPRQSQVVGDLHKCHAADPKEGV